MTIYPTSWRHPMRRWLATVAHAVQQWRQKYYHVAYHLEGIRDGVRISGFGHISIARDRRIRTWADVKSIATLIADVNAGDGVTDPAIAVLRWTRLRGGAGAKDLEIDLAAPAKELADARP